MNEAGSWTEWSLHVIPVLWALKQEDQGAQATLGFAMRLCFKTTANRSRDNQGTGSFTYVKLEHLQAWQSRPTGVQTQPFPPSKCSPTSDLSLSTSSLIDQKHLNGTLWMPLAVRTVAPTSMANGGMDVLPVGILNRPIFLESCKRWMVFIHLPLKIEGNKWWELLCPRPSLSRRPCMEGSPLRTGFEHQPYPYTKV